METGEQVDYGIIHVRDVVRSAYQVHHRSENALCRGKDLFSRPRNSTADDLDRLEKATNDIKETPLPVSEVRKLLILVANESKERVCRRYRW